MSYTLEKQSDSIIILTISEDYDASAEAGKFFNEINDILDNETSPVNLILDVLEYKLTFEELLSSTRNAMNLKSPFAHKMVKQTILVTSSNLMKASIKGFQRFGIAGKSKVVASLDEAMAFAKSSME